MLEEIDSGLSGRCQVAAKEGGAEGVGSMRVTQGEVAGVEVEGDRDGRVPKLLLQPLRVTASGDVQAGERVPQGMGTEAGVGQPGAGEDALELLRNDGLVEGAPMAGDEHPGGHGPPGMLEVRRGRALAI